MIIIPNKKIPKRYIDEKAKNNPNHPKTGIFFFAYDKKGKRHPTDIAHLTQESFWELLESKDKLWLMNLSASLLGFEQKEKI